jgi:hypothetical protein
LLRRFRQSPLYDGRRPRPFRQPLDWESNYRAYLAAGAVVFAVPVVGLRLLVIGRWWERPVGLVVFCAGLVLAFGVVQWLRRPVDPRAAGTLEAQHRQSGTMRWWYGPDKPPPGFFTVDLRRPWVRPSQKLADAFADEASREVTSGHPLFSKELICRARCEVCDLLVFESHDGTWAIVRLTGRLRQRPPLPETVRFDSYVALEAAMNEHRHPA